MEQFNANYWDERYQNNQIGWDLGQCSPPIKAYIDQLTAKNIAILIPGCGNAHEAAYLLSKGFTNITLVDIAPSLVAKLKQQFEGTAVNVLLGNFFDLTGSFDLIIEQTFFCAIDPSQRKTYVNKVASLLKPGKKLVGLLFNKEFNQPGPPFGGTVLAYEELFSEAFIILTMEVAYNGIKPRQNTEVFINFSKK